MTTTTVVIVMIVTGIPLNGSDIDLVKDRTNNAALQIRRVADRILYRINFGTPPLDHEDVRIEEVR